MSNWGFNPAMWVMVLGGIQFITTGIIAELQMRTYFESQHKTPYRIKRISVTSEK